ncbi:MAG: hypothetical protein BGO01_13190 [Armatimonadetes bacterium 55-13]|nr:LacI family DNA-binding transcriptional regulator [Armatimonadota bacterium]OJU61864.1 MAG: hypothetical protein BGO01_13190 [Armatimonadetes bacterium 55-13]
MPVTLRDIAKHVNLSHATVSFVLNDRGDVAIPETTRNRILEAAKELGYQPNRAARALARGKTQMVALWIPSSYNPFYAQVLYYMQSCVRRSQYDMIYYQTYFGTDDLDDKLRSLSWPVDAILAIDSMYLLETLANAPELADRPIVSIGAYSHLSRDSVSIDLGAGVREAMDHLIATGRKRIAFIRPYNPPDTEDPRNREYLAKLKAAGLKPEIIETSAARRAVVLEETKAYFAKHGVPEAIFAYNDNMAVAIVRALHDLGVKIPDDCVICGCDGIDEVEYTEPQLTTIVQPIQQMCELGWQFTLDRIANPHEPARHEVLVPELTIRQSTGG